MEQATRNRSPEHPGADLPTALERAEELYEQEAFNWTSPEVAAGHWNYSPKSSGGFRMLAALKHFGLLEDMGTSKDRRVRLTDLARRIIRDKREGSVDRVRAIREAALSPSIYAKLWERWGAHGKLPSRATMEFELEHEWEFNPKAISDFIQNFVSTIEYSGLLNHEGDIPGEGGEAEADKEGETPRRSAQRRPDALAPDRTRQTSTSDSLELPLPLPSGRVATLRIPMPLDERDYALLRATLESSLTVMKPALVRENFGEGSG